MRRVSGPRNINDPLTKKIAAHPLKAHLPPDWRAYCANSRRGYCRPKSRYITVPAWTFRRGSDFVTYYLAHELAHINGGQDHGKAFYDEFKRICPEHLQHFELKYKPRNAAAAGITERRNDG